MRPQRPAEGGDVGDAPLSPTLDVLGTIGSPAQPWSASLAPADSRPGLRTGRPEGAVESRSRKAVSMRGNPMSERRELQRRPAGFKVRVSGLNGRRRAEWQEGRAIDISEKGVRLELAHQRFPIRNALVEFRLPPGVLVGYRARRVCLRGRVVWSLVHPRAGNGARQQVALEFESRRLTDVLQRPSRRRLAWLSVILIVFAIVNAVVLKTQALDYFWHRPVLTLYGLCVTTYLLSRFVISAFYRPPRDTGYRPSLSVIVACKNEEDAIAQTLERVFATGYPRDLLEVIAIDDGSTDRTYDEMERVHERHPELRLIRFPKNLGKRHGMAAGARAAHGEVLVFVDSDSFLEKEGLYRIAQGFADPAVGASSGHSFVANASKNWLTRTQAVQYFIAFRVMKAAESIYSSVTCCSGCFAAYRRTAVLEVLDEWLEQKFLGQSATFGDDRSLTNYMLRKHKVIYDSAAHASTIVPDNLQKFLRQQLRWKKSWLRETMRAAGFMWKRPPVMAFSFYAGFLFPLLGPLVVFRALVYMTIVQGHPSFLYMWGVMVMGLLYSAYYLLHQRNRMWFYGVLMCPLYAFLLNWQLPWAILTSWNNKWGTR